MSAKRPWKSFAVKALIGVTAYLLVLAYAAAEGVKANKAPLPVMQKLKLLVPELFWATGVAAVFVLVCYVKSKMVESLWDPTSFHYDEEAEKRKIRLFGRVVLALIGLLAVFFAVVGIGGFDPAAQFLNDYCSQENPRLRGAEGLANGRSIALDFFYCLVGAWVAVRLIRWAFKKSPKVVMPEAFQLSDQFEKV